MKIKKKLFKVIILASLLCTTNIKAEITNKILISVGNKIITEYDVNKEILFLNILNKKEIEKLNPKETKKIAIETLIVEKTKLIGLSMYPDLYIKEKQIRDSLIRLSQNLEIDNIENLKIFFNEKEYDFKKMIKKIELELKWNQLVYQLNKNRIIVNQKIIDKKLKELILNQKQAEYLISEIFIKDSNNKSLDNKSNEVFKSIESNGFVSAAIKFSSSSSSQQGGNLGWVAESQIAEHLLEYIKKTDVGKITDRIYVPNGIIILKIEDKRIVEKKIDIEKKMEILIEKEKNKQLNQYSVNYYNQIKNNNIVKYFNE